MLFSKTTSSNSYIHPYTNGDGCHARQCLAQGHLDMQTFGEQDAGSTPEIQPPTSIVNVS